jgi:hypothetical protein
MRKFTEAATYFERALAITEKSHGRQQTELPLILSQLADVYRNMGVRLFFSSSFFSRLFFECFRISMTRVVGVLIIMTMAASAKSHGFFDHSWSRTYVHASCEACIHLKDAHAYML